MKKKILISLTLLAFATGAAIAFRKKPEKWQELPVISERFLLHVAQSGTVQPENKISVNAPIAGRIDQILVEEGTKVRRGQILAWMSSTDRAALLDSAQSQGPDVVKEMMEVYKPTPILSPMRGVIIHRNVVVGQTVTLASVLFDLSDRLIVVADVDETDLGKIREGQTATVKVDSFPDLPVNAKVSRIAHQSVTKNSINVYPVTLEPEKIPPEFRAGLTASVYFLQKDLPSALVLPAWVAGGRENFSTTLQVKTASGAAEERTVRFGASNGQKVEVREGLKAGELVLVKEQSVLSENTSTSPFGGPPRMRSSPRGTRH